MLLKPHQRHQLLKWKTWMYLRHFWTIWVGYLKKIIGNHVRRQRAKTKYSEMQGIGLNNSIVEATCRVKRKSYAEVARNVKTTPSPKVSVNFSDIVSDLLESKKSNSSMI